jgi:hypothetical protein
MTVSITLWDAGYGPSIDDWRVTCERVFSEQGARFGARPPRKGTGGRNRLWFGDARDALEFDDARVGCHIWLTSVDIDRPLCRLLFELAERARLFVLFGDAPQFLRPPSLRGLDLDRGSVPIMDMDGSEALFQFTSSRSNKRRACDRNALPAAD